MYLHHQPTVPGALWKRNKTGPTRVTRRQHHRRSPTATLQQRPLFGGRDVPLDGLKASIGLLLRLVVIGISLEGAFLLARREAGKAFRGSSAADSRLKLMRAPLKGWCWIASVV
jgi:hypothetical protein